MNPGNSKNNLFVDKNFFRPFRRDEVFLYQQWMTDPAVLGPYVEREKRLLTELLTEYDEDGWQGTDHKYWVYDNGENQILGYGHCWRCDLLEEHVEFGRILLPQWRGKGHGLSMAKRLIDKAFESFPAYRVQAITACENKIILKHWQKAGMQEEGRLRAYMTIKGEHVDAYLGSILRPEWELSRSAHRYE